MLVILFGARIVRKRDLMFLERDFLARCLMTVCGLTESSAYQVTQ